MWNSKLCSREVAICVVDHQTLEPNYISHCSSGLPRDSQSRMHNTYLTYVRTWRSWSTVSWPTLMLPTSLLGTPVECVAGDWAPCHEDSCFSCRGAEATLGTPITSIGDCSRREGMELRGVAVNGTPYILQPAPHKHNVKR